MSDNGKQYDSSRVYIFNVNENSIIGKPGINPATGRVVIRNPRLVMITPGATQGSLQMQLFPLVGAPDEVEIDTKPLWHYAVIDNAVLGVYMKATTGLDIPIGLEVVKR